MKLRVKCNPYENGDAKWQVIVEHGQCIDHLRVADGGKDAAEVIARTYGMRPAVASRALANVGTYYTFEPAKRKEKPTDPAKTPVAKALRKAVRK